jgi:predicted AAA+ superfamily ATPase
VEVIIVQTVRNWISLERFFSLHGKGEAPLSSASNILITGVRGVGKTTLMRGLFEIILKHKKHVEPYYVDYEQTPSNTRGNQKPSQLITPKFTGDFTQFSYDKWSKENLKG